MVLTSFPRIDFSTFLAALLDFTALSSSPPFDIHSYEPPVAFDHPVCSENCCPWTCVPSNEYFLGDSRLGPTTLPSCLPLSSAYSPYNRLGGHTCPSTFLSRWTCSSSSSKNSYIYPPSHGFQLSLSGAPIVGEQTLVPGMIVDRFGSESGCFLSPASTPFTMRSLPPQSLNDDPNDPGIPFNYRVYEVKRPLTVLSGPIAAWFGQPGQGTQYQTSVSVGELIKNGFLERVDIRRTKN
ncbi:hypothetical protein DL96DRAFT_1209942 [Flagelloscypha sp. PMI_526]|nr:hypothetical protein DL96DRAFT_1209942 [Flagelloscypha sp. PMI_526]